MPSIQYTVRGIPAELDAQLRREAHDTGKSLNSLVIETLEHAKLSSSPVIHDDLDWFIGSRRSSGHEDDTQAWLDALPAELE
jgi:hypothetical protein